MSPSGTFSLRLIFSTAGGLGPRLLFEFFDAGSEGSGFKGSITGG
jgi:hypothetical protein